MVRWGDRFEGTGLGLIISKKLAELMGGSVAVFSELGRGSIFLLEVPAQTGAAPANPTSYPR